MGQADRVQRRAILPFPWTRAIFFQKSAAFCSFLFWNLSSLQNVHECVQLNEFPQTTHTS